MLPNPQETADLVTFTEEIFNVKLHFFMVYKIRNSKILSYLDWFYLVDILLNYKADVCVFVNSFQGNGLVYFNTCQYSAITFLKMSEVVF